MNHDALVARLEQLHGTINTMVAALDDADYRRQHHPELSPLGWHLGHTLFIEDFWLRGQLCGNGDPNASEYALYLPENNVKAERGSRLPNKTRFLAQICERQAANLDLLRNLPDEFAHRPLFQSGYLLKFLVQHHAQHVESMRMALAQKQINASTAPLPPGGLAQAAAVRRDAVDFADGEYPVGGRDNWSFDNELPRQITRLENFSINRKPVTNAEYLGFIMAGGYRHMEYWSEAGRHWLQSTGTGATAPDSWRQSDDGSWFRADCTGLRVPAAEAPVHGIAHHEAAAFARYAKARLPHEYEWEAACASGALAGHGGTRSCRQPCAWEWCSNVFHPYPEFKAFPYPQYSTPWFGNGHYVLRGASEFSEMDCRRPSFRNFHTPEKRHIFAGLRLAF